MGQHLDNLICYGYGATRRMGKGSLTRSSNATEHPLANDAVANLFFNYDSLINAEEWYLQIDYAVFSATTKSERLKRESQRDQIKKILISLLPDIDDIKISEKKGAQIEKQLDVKTPYGWVYIQDLSLGYKTLIAWVVDLACKLFERYPGSKAPLLETAVVLIDEIDLHLHPRFQRIIMEYLTKIFPNIQFIATAHSPLIVQSSSEANIVLLRREGNQTIIDNSVQNVKNWRIDQILTSELFDLESARPPYLDSLVEEREKLLSKARLSKKDELRLSEIREQMGDLSFGETPADIEAFDIVRRAARLLEQK